MAEHSLIEWTDATWNPITGCSVVSPGCTNCYAMKLAGGRLRHQPSRAGLTLATKAGPVWNGQVRLNEAELLKPLSWRRPRKIFVCAHGDLFHESVPDAWIDRVFAVMALCPEHTFQVLTKRSARMRAYSTNKDTVRRIIHEAFRQDCEAGAWMSADHEIAGEPVLPLPNIWLGVSAEDQDRANERVRDLIATPAAVRFISAEPLLGPLDLCTAGMKINGKLDLLSGERRFIGWVIVGGESGPGARPMHPDWARQIRDDCGAAGVPFFFKQWGACKPMEGGAWIRGGKKAAGRLLDGVEHNAMPAATR